MTRVLVCGGRDYNDYDTVCRVLDDLLEHGEVTIIHGAARGADSLADRWAAERGVERYGFPARWDEHRRAAGWIRNQEMIDEGCPDLVVAFPGGNGTADMVRRARLAGIHVMEIAR